MNVAAILKQKGRTVTTARPTMTLMEVANKLVAKRIGAIVIVKKLKRLNRREVVPSRRNVTIGQ